MRYLKTLFFIKIIFICSLIDLNGQAIFTLPDITANNGDTFCMEVTAEELTEVLSMQFSVNWDPLLLEFESINNIATSFATASIPPPNTSGGTLSFSWFSGNPDGVSLPANDILFEICFTVIGDIGGSTNITFTNNPSFIEVITTASSPNSIGLMTQGGTIMGTDSIQPLVFTVPSEWYSSGVSFCIPVDAMNFVDLVSIQFSINWDSAVLQYDSITAIAIPESTINDFGMPNPTGNIGYSWFDNTLFGVTLPDNTTVFEICFTVVGDPNEFTQIEFTDDPVPIEVIQGEVTNIGLSSSGGVITVLQSLFITNAAITGTSCNNPDNAAIDITMAGGLLPYTYMWSNNETTEDLTNLDAGTYTLTVVDSNNPPNVRTETYIVPGDFEDPIAIAGPDTSLTCTDPVLIIDGTNSSFGNEFTHQWTTSGMGVIQNPNSLAPSVNSTGLYTLLVTNTENGCTASDDIIVGGTAIPPVANAGTGGELTCQISEITLTGSVDPVATGYSYQWTNTTTGTVVSTDLSVVTNESGLYEFFVTDASGCTDFDTVSVFANIALPIANAGGDMELNCQDAEVMLDGSGSSEGTDIIYEWTSTNSSSIQNPTTTNPTVSEVGTYQLEVTNTTTNCTTTATVNVTQNVTPPTAEAGDGGTIDCMNSTVTLNGNGSSSGTNFTYEWNSINGNIASGDFTLMPIVDNEGIYILTVTDTTNHCIAIDSSEVTANGILPMANAGTDRIINCEIETVQLDGSESSLGVGYSYEWITDEGNIASGGDFVVPLVTAGGEYTLIVTDTINFCSSTSTVTVTVDTIAPIALPDQVGPLTCIDNELTLTNQNSSGTNGITFQWTTTNGSIINATPFGDIIVNGAGDYTLIVKDNNNQCTGSEVMTLEADNDLPEAEAGAAVVLTCDDTAVNLDGTASSMGNDFTYSWTTISGNIISGNETLEPEIDEEGMYHLEVMDTTNGCIMLDSVEVIKDVNFPIVNAGPNGTLDCITTEIILNGTGNTSTGASFLIEWTTTGDGNIVSGGNTLTPTVNGAGPYTLTITNTNNQCSSSDLLIVSSNSIEPIANAGADTAIVCEATTLVLDGANSSVGTEFEYSWTTSNGNIITNASQLGITVDTAGTYELLITNSNNGCTSLDEVVVTQDTSPLPIADVQQNSNLNCYNSTVILDGTASTISSTQSFEWIGNGNYVADTTTLTPVIDAPGFYSLVITDNVTGCISQSSAFILIDTMTPMATATVDGSLDCQNNFVTLDGTGSTTGQFIIYEWTTSNGSIDTDSSLMMIDASAGGEYQLMVADTINGCSATMSVEVTIDTLLPMADAGGAMLEMPCDATSIFLDGSASSTGNEFEYLWTTSNGSIINDAIELTPEIESVGIYTLTVTNTTNNCMATSQIEVTEPDAVIAVAEANAQLDCSSSSVVLNGDGSSVGANIVYLWTTTDGNIISDATTLMPEIDAPGTYILAVANTISGCTETVSVLVEFSNAFSNADAGTDNIVCENSAPLSANLPAGTTGIWLTNGSAMFANPSDPNTMVNNLAAGANIFSWTLSAPGCPEYSVDTVIVMLENMPDAIDDTYSILQNSGLYEFNTSNNDTGNNTTSQALSGVANGVLVDLGNGGFSYIPDEDFIGIEMFDYELCSNNCPDACDIATVSIAIEEIPPFDPDSIMVEYNAITPNGDGLNDVFIFDFLESNPDQFPDNELVVFNRWGDIVYEAKPYNNDWGGTNLKGTDLPQGTYYYILRLDITERIILKGDVTILK